jgi:RNA polymerase sigma-70 factor (ECF subfamily)
MDDRADPDHDLVQRAREGDEAAFRELVERHQERILQLAWRVAGSRVEAEEIAQDAFVRAWQALPGFRGESRFATWMHRITTRVALDRREAVRRRERREVGVEEEVLAGLAAMPESVAEGDRITARARVALLAGLSEAQRTVVTLHYLEDRPVIEVAQAMGVPENTVKTHLSRARAAMRDAFLRAEAKHRGAVR